MISYRTAFRIEVITVRAQCLDRRWIRWVRRANSWESGFSNCFKGTKSPSVRPEWTRKSASNSQRTSLHVDHRTPCIIVSPIWCSLGCYASDVTLDSYDSTFIRMSCWYSHLFDPVIVLNRPSVTSKTTLELFPCRIQQFPCTQDTVRGNNTTMRQTAPFGRWFGLS